MRKRKTIPVVFLLVAAIAGCGGGGKKSSTTTAPQPTPTANSVAATPAQLRALARQVGHDIFWAGQKHGYTYELTHTVDGNIYIRYLPPGVPVGAGSADFLAIGTYPQADAFATIRTAEKRPGEIIKRLKAGDTAVVGSDRRNSVYFAHPGSKLLVEVYDPSPTRALALATSGKVRPLH